MQKHLGILLLYLLDNLSLLHFFDQYAHEIAQFPRLSVVQIRITGDVRPTTRWFSVSNRRLHVSREVLRDCPNDTITAQMLRRREIDDFFPRTYTTSNDGAGIVVGSY